MSVLSGSGPVLCLSQVRIPSRVDKPGSSPVKQFNQEVSCSVA